MFSSCPFADYTNEQGIGIAMAQSVFPVILVSLAVHGTFQSNISQKYIGSVHSVGSGSEGGGGLQQPRHN